MSEIETTPVVLPTAEEYERIIKGMQLLSVGLTRCQVELLDRETLTQRPSELESQFNSGASYQIVEAEGKEIVLAFQEISVIFGFEGKPVLVLHCSYQLDYLAENSFTAGAFEIFKGTALPTHAIPYARQLFQSLTSQMNVQPVVLPMFFAPLWTDEIREAANPPTASATP